MFTTGTRGYGPSCVFFFVVVFILGSRSVIGKPQNFQKSTQPILRFSPELMMEPTLESAVSPISLLPRSPSGDPKKAPTPYKHDDVPDEDFPDLSLDLDGPPDKWEQDPDILDSDIPLPRRLSGGVPEPPKKKVFVPPNLEDDVDVDRLHGKLFGFREEDSDEDLGVPEAWERLKMPEAYPHSAETGSGHGPLPHGDADQEILGSEQLMDKDMDIDEAVLPPYTNSPLTDKAHALRTNAGPWKDVDRPTRPGSSRPNTQPTTTYGKTLSQWKELALSGLAVDTNTNMYGDDEDVDLDGEKNPFVDDDDDDEEDEVPEELVRQVVDALEARPAWRELSTPKQDRDRLARTLRTREFDEDDNDDWFPRRRAEPQNSRLIALIFQTVDDPNALKTEEEDDDDLYEEKINIWQILTNFPFPMLLGRNDDRDDIAKTFDDEYDEEYYDDYDEDDYDEDEYDDDEYDDEDYEDEDGSEDEDVDDDNDDDDDRDGTYDVTRDDDRLQFKQKDMENESDDVYDVFYEYEYEDCDDCSEDSYVDSVQKEDFTILSLPPIFTK